MTQQTPTPNEHGVYSKDDATKVLAFSTGERAYVKAYFMQMPSGRWAVGYDCRYGDSACSGPLTDAPYHEASEQEAVDDFLERITDDLTTETEGNISDDKKADCRELLRKIAEYGDQGRLF